MILVEVGLEIESGAMVLLSGRRRFGDYSEEETAALCAWMT